MTKFIAGALTAAAFLLAFGAFAVALSGLGWRLGAGDWQRPRFAACACSCESSG